MKEKDNGFLFLADVHVKSRTWNNTTLLQEDAYTALAKLKGICQARQIDTIVSGGDWFDSTRPSARDVMETLDFLSDFYVAYGISGNHDNTEPGWLQALDQAQRLSPDYVFMLDKNTGICGIDWCSSAEKLLNGLSRMSSTVAESLPKGAVLYCVLHNGLQELLDIDGTYETSVPQLASVCPDVEVRYLVGHVHTRAQFPCNGGYVHSPGSLYPVSADRMGEPCLASIVHSDGTVEAVDVSVRHYSRIAARSLAEVDSAVAALRHDLELPPYLLVTTPDDSGLAVPASRYPDACVQIRTESEQETVEQAAGELPGASTMEAAVRQAASYDSDIADMSVALLNSDDPLETLFSWFGSWNVETVEKSAKG